jgi:hypothetical protein
MKVMQQGPEITRHLKAGLDARDLRYLVTFLPTGQRKSLRRFFLRDFAFPSNRQAHRKQTQLLS